VPLSTPVVALNATLDGSGGLADRRLNVMLDGTPVAVTVNEPGDPTAKVVVAALVKTGAWSMVR
jgi:hypothetical protein